jgi:hypothetical protein
VKKRKSISSSEFLERLADVLDGLDADSLADFVAHLRRSAIRLKKPSSPRRRKSR